MSKESRAQQAASFEAMTDWQLANLAATIIFLILGPRALHALKAPLALHNAPGVQEARK